MAGFNDSQNPVFDCGNKKPMRVRTFRAPNAQGRMVTRTERRPQGKYLMVVDHYGHVNPLKLHNSISEMSEFDPYKMHQLSSPKMRGNPEWGLDPMIPVCSCPQQTSAQFHLPSHLQTGTACRVAVDGKSIGEDQAGEIHWCQCIEQLVKERRERNAELEASRDPKTTIQQAILNNSQETTSQLVKLLEHITKEDAVKAAVLKASDAAPAGKSK